MCSSYLKIINQAYLIRGRRIGIIDLILILFFMLYKIKYVKYIFCLVMRNPFRERILNAACKFYKIL